MPLTQLASHAFQPSLIHKHPRNSLSGDSELVYYTYSTGHFQRVQSLEEQTNEAVMGAHLNILHNPGQKLNLFRYRRAAGFLGVFLSC